MSRQTYSEYQRACREILAFFGQHRLLSDIQPREFTSLRRRLAKGRGPVAIRNLVSRVKTVFNFGYQDGLLEQAPQYPSHEEETLDS